MTPPPLLRRPGWVEQVYAPQSDAEVADLRCSIQRGSPFGEPTWTEQTVPPGLAHPTSLGRPRKNEIRFLTPI